MQYNGLFNIEKKILLTACTKLGHLDFKAAVKSLKMPLKPVKNGLKVEEFSPSDGKSPERRKNVFISSWRRTYFVHGRELS